MHGSGLPTHILQTSVFVFVGTEYFWGLIVDLSFPGCVVLGQGLSLSGSSSLIGEPRAGKTGGRLTSTIGCRAKCLVSATPSVLTQG